MTEVGSWNAEVGKGIEHGAKSIAHGVQRTEVRVLS
jgi:hypothetical protein